MIHINTLSMGRIQVARFHFERKTLVFVVRVKSGNKDEKLVILLKISVSVVLVLKY